LKSLLTCCNQYYRRKKLYGIIIKAIVEEDNLHSRLKNVMEVGMARKIIVQITRFRLMLHSNSILHLDKILFFIHYYAQIKKVISDIIRQI
jgi:hypothetical protein